MLPKVLQNQIPLGRYMGSFTPLPASSSTAVTSILTLAASYCHLDWELLIGNLTSLSTISEIRQVVNGDITKRYLPSDLDVINQYSGLNPFSKNNILRIREERNRILSSSDGVDFKNSQFYSASAKNLSIETSLNCGSQDSNGNSIAALQWEVDFLSTGATAPTLQMYSRAIPPQTGGAGSVLRVDKQTFNAVSGTNTINRNQALKIGDALRQYINRLYLMCPSGMTLDNFQIFYGSHQWDPFPAALLADRAAAFGWTEQSAAGLYVIDFQLEHWGDTMLFVGGSNSDMSLQFVASAGGAITVYQESIGLITPAQQA